VQCNTPTVGRQNFILLKNSRPPYGVSNPILLVQGFPTTVTILRTELRTGGYTSLKLLGCSLVEAMGLPRGSDSIGSSRTSGLQNSGVLDSPDSDSTEVRNSRTDTGRIDGPYSCHSQRLRLTSGLGLREFSTLHSSTLPEYFRYRSAGR
jgi:hypothetical protein